MEASVEYISLVISSNLISPSIEFTNKDFSEGSNAEDLLIFDGI